MTEGPWVYEFRSDWIDGVICMGDVQQWQQHKQFDIDLHRDDGNDPDDLAFIAAARQLVPDLIAALEAAEALERDLRDAVIFAMIKVDTKQ
ncbi:MAG: hypothetical protein U5N55_07985 [Cypionkella sp.]|nr:hypothetical protein [Cypionkella sp.]